MIRAMEEHLAAWMEQQVRTLAAESGLYGPVRTITGALELSARTKLEEDAVAILVQVESLTPLPENRDLGPTALTQDAALHMSARIGLRLMGEGDPLPKKTGRTVRPDGAHLHRVDLVALSLLAQLRERPGPRADEPEPPGLDELQGQAPMGAATATEGARRARLIWTALEAGEVMITPANKQKLREWAIPLTAVCTFRLSPAKLEGGRIMAIQSELDVHDRPFRRYDATLYAPAEALPLDHFDGLADDLVAELGLQGVDTLGKLGALDVAGVKALAKDLRSDTAASRKQLEQLASLASLRQTVALEGGGELHPSAMALPARALLAPTPDEADTLRRWVASPALSARITMIAVPVAYALKAEKRETVTVGTLLSRGR